MSRGFVKESDQEPAPLITPRAVLPAGETNYVTPRGLRLLHEEQAELESELIKLNSAADGPQARSELTVARSQLAQLTSRVASVQLLTPADVEVTEVHFGATVSYHIDGQQKLVEVTIVGVDEANLKERRISYLSPIAKALMGKSVGVKAKLSAGGEERVLELVKIEYREEEAII